MKPVEIVLWVLLVLTAVLIALIAWAFWYYRPTIDFRL
jgi:Flp pilus assembly protein CpaB